MKTKLILFLSFTSLVVSGPIPFDFNESWDYKINPHDDPLIQVFNRSHSLPLRRMSKQKTVIPEIENLQDISKLKGEAQGMKLTCGACRLGVALLRAEVDKNSSFDDIQKKFVGVCAGLSIATEGVCSGIFDAYGPIIIDILKVIELDATQICSLLLGTETCEDVENLGHDWKIELSEKPKGYLREIPPPSEYVETLKVLHLSDTHFDPQYVEGSPTNCKEPLCCRSYSTPNDVDFVPAGKWGSLGKCDAPKALIENMFEHIATEHPDIDYIIWTGDIPPHDIWNQTKEQNIENYRYTTKQIFDTFPNIPVFPALGNHESVPSGNFPPPWMKNPDFSVNWLYDEVAKEWAKWLPDDVNGTVLHGGFYNVLVRPKFRIISINTNFCHAVNWWLALNSTDPAQELKWLVYELEKAEERDEKVHIIGHIPPGATDCYKVWSKNYYEIINRFRNTVVAQFFGHTHNDEFEIFYDDETKEASAIAFIGPSVTTFENLNPGYRIYYVDAISDNSSKEVVDHETWIMDLATSNANPDEDTLWYKLYSARTAYGMDNLRPSEWDKLVESFAKDSKLFDQFYRYYNKNSPTRSDCKKNKCKFDIICGLKSARSHYHHFCDMERELLKPEES